MPSEKKQPKPRSPFPPASWERDTTSLLPVLKHQANGEWALAARQAPDGIVLSRDAGSRNTAGEGSVNPAGEGAVNPAGEGSVGRVHVGWREQADVQDR